MLQKRGSGILLHITSLPSVYGIGDFGPGAYAFADFLAGTRQAYWQLLPLNPTIEICGNSPYSSISAFAGNIFLISPDALVQEGLLTDADTYAKPEFPESRCDYSAVIHYKEKLLHRAFEHFKVTALFKKEFDDFCFANASW